MGELLGPDGEPARRRRGGTVEVPEGQALDIKVIDQTEILIDGMLIKLPLGVWRLVPAELWFQMAAKMARLETEITQYRGALGVDMFGEKDLEPISRQRRRAARRALRN